MLEKWFNKLRLKAIDLSTKKKMGPGEIGFTITKELGSGFSVEKEREENRKKLEIACWEAVKNPEWCQKPDGTTFCNFAAQFVANKMGCKDLDGLMANECYDKMNSTPSWTKDTAEIAVKHAMSGGLAFAAVKAATHGHLAAIYPQAMERSETWDQLVPFVANVGVAPNAIKKVSAAFKLANKPDYFLWGTV